MQNFSVRKDALYMLKKLQDWRGTKIVISKDKNALHGI